MRNYEPAPEVENIAKEKVIPDWHADLKDFNVCCLFTDPMASKGRVVIAKIQKSPPLVLTLTGYDLILTVNREAWEALSAKQRVAVVDHEFCHVEVAEDGRPRMIGHDIEEFHAVVARHGQWLNDIERFATQLELFKSSDLQKECDELIGDMQASIDMQANGERMDERT